MDSGRKDEETGDGTVRLGQLRAGTAGFIRGQEHWKDAYLSGKAKAVSSVVLSQTRSIARIWACIPISRLPADYAQRCFGDLNTKVWELCLCHVCVCEASIRKSRGGVWDWERKRMPLKRVSGTRHA